MALGTASSAGNIKRSIDTYIHDNLYTIEGLSIDFEGLPFDSRSVVSNWVQPRIIDFDSIFYRQGSGTQYGELVNVLFQINVFTKQSGTTAASEHYRIRDVVAGYFKIGDDIAVKNYVGDGSTNIDSLRVRDIKDVIIPESKEFYQHSFSIEMDYTRLTTEA